MGKISAIDIKKLFFGVEPNSNVTPIMVKAMVSGGGYIACTSTTMGALKIVSNDKEELGNNEVKLEDVAPYYGLSTNKAINKYVKFVDGCTEIANIHQDTWNIEEGEATQDSYKNQLNGHVYRMGKRQMGDLTISFTIGQYDYALKSALMGGDMLDSDGMITDEPTEAVGWKRSDEPVELYKCLIALTYDDVYLILPRTSIGSREGNTDGAIGISMNGTMMDPINKGVSSEYWYDKATVGV